MKNSLSTLSHRHRRPRAEAASFALKALPLAVALCFCPSVRSDVINPGTAGLPMGGAVASGSVSNTLTADTLTLTQSTARAVIDWASFNIASGKTVNFIQPGASAAVLNRVQAGANMSEIAGTLSANGTVLLMNPNGVMFYQGANINVGSLIVTTGTVNQGAFEAGESVNTGAFAITGATTGSIINEGSITAANAGLVALVAPSVANRGAGTIIATGGRIRLSGADRGTVSFNGNLFEFAVDSGAQGTNASLSNGAGARLEGAHILLSTGDAANLVSGVINLQGVQQASGAIVVDGDTVVLKSDLDAPTLSGSSNTVQVHDTASIQDAVKIAKTGTAGAGATVAVQAGTFHEQVTLDKANLRLLGDAGAKVVAPNSAVAGIRVTANDVTVQDLEIAGPLALPFTALSTADWNSTPSSHGIFVGQNVTGFNITGNKIHDVRTGIRVDGRGNTGSITSNELENTKGGILFQYTDGAGVSMTGNRQGSIGNEWGIALNINRALNSGDASAEQQAYLLGLSNSNNSLSVLDRAYATSNRTHVAVDASSTATAAADDFNLGNGLGNMRQPLKTVQAGIDAVVSGGSVKVAAGNYTQTSKLLIEKSLTLQGAGQSSTVIDARSITGTYGMEVKADNVTLSDFTFYGPSAYYNAAYGIKVSPGGAADARLRNFTIRNVTSRGAGKAELDLNGVDGALIDNVTLNGRPVDNSTDMSQGAGLQLTDSANVTVRNTTTLNNQWGGLALYQANKTTGGYNQQVNNITIEGNNHFNEFNPVYMQDESALHDFGSLNIAGFDYAVRNATNAGSGQYTWLQRTKQGAYDLAVNVPVYLSGANIGSSYIQGWNGSGRTQVFEVGVGNQIVGSSTQAQAMSIAAAVYQSSTGAAINVGAGTYGEQITLNKAGLTLRGDGAKLQVPDAAEVNAITISANNVTVEGMEIAGPLNGVPYYTYYRSEPGYTTPGNISRGIVVGSDVANFTIRNNNVHDVRTGVLINGLGNSGSVADNTIENTKSGISVQYTGGTDIAMTGNRDKVGGVGNEWGVNLNLNKSPKLDTPTLEWQQKLLDLSAANSGWTVQDQGYTAANRTHVNVATGGGAGNQGSRLTPISTIQAGMNATVRGGTVNVMAGSYAESLSVDRLLNLRFNDVTLQGLALTSAASGSGIGGRLTANSAAGLALDAPVHLLADTTLASNAGDLSLNGLVQNTGTNAYALTLTARDNIRGNVRVPTLSVNAGNRVDMTVDVATADVRAGVQADLTGRATRIGVNAPHGNLTGSFGTVENTGNGVIVINGRALLSDDVAPVIDRIRIVPVIVLPPPAPPLPLPPPAPVALQASVDITAQPATASGSGNETGAAPAGNGSTSTTTGGTTGGGGATVLGAVPGPRQVPVVRSSPRGAGDSLARGQGVEIDLSPGR